MNTAKKVTINSADVFRETTLVSFATTWLPSFESHIEVLESLKKRFPDLKILVMMVHLDSVEIDTAAILPHLRRPMEFAICSYDVAVDYAGHENVLFPSSFLVKDGRILVDLAGKVEAAAAAESLAPKLVD